ncbi:unnamed protein product [Lepeophtheirus salmonis]|uniref:(salmon louse) hypothetical protein n=1 Tax=Lepeophtheirus salmonis TaxID=72036 RepID=A0A7R8CWI3_LEPSM|nr:unnamed protein product [Lepeophtheirus salmonis]CAF2922399.1 unnamed protein product [Lepeophtheirus salmonis]
MDEYDTDNIHLSIKEIHRIVSSDHTLKIGSVLYRELKEVKQITKSDSVRAIHLIHSRAIGEKIYQRRKEICEDMPINVMDCINFAKEELNDFERDWAEHFHTNNNEVRSRLLPWINNGVPRETGDN